MSRAQPALSLEAIELAAFGRILWARKWRLLAVAAASFLTAFVVCSAIPARYKAGTSLLLDGTQNAFVRAESQRNDRSPADMASGFSQLELLASREVAALAIAREKLAEKPEFTQDAGSWWQRLVGLSSSGDRTEDVTAAYFRRLSIRGVKDTRVVDVEFWSEDRELAARVANAIVDAYFELKRKTWQSQASNASDWLSLEVEALKRSVAEADERLNAYRDSSGLLATTERSSIESQQLNEVTARLSQARSTKATVEAKVQRLNNLLLANRLSEATDVANSASMQSLSRRRQALTTQLAQLGSSLMESHPRYRQLRAQVAEIDSEMQSEARRILRALENDIAVADGRIRALEDSINGVRTEARTSNFSALKLRELERESRVQRQLLEIYLLKQGEASIQKTLDVPAADVRQISKAAPPLMAYFPKKTPIAVIAVIAALMADMALLLAGQFGAAAQADKTAPAKSNPQPMTARRPRRAVQRMSRAA
jgi:uncharacterized protein involved in exopolysaccharide biosynthesis